jgi:SAM-dependent methyltransferase
MSWTDYWNADTTIYVNARHKQVHYQVLAQEFVGLVCEPTARVLDFGCGDALSAGLLAGACQSLVLCDAAGAVRDRLVEHTAAIENIKVITVSDLRGLPDGAFDLIIANSVVQYLSLPELVELLAVWRGLLSPSGVLVLGDVVPSNVGPLRDATSLLQFAAGNGFLIAAGWGLVKTVFSDYRKSRMELGLLRFEEAAILALVREQGFAATRHWPNLGHNQHRMTIRAQVASAPLHT